jgi:hypothetical protein
MQRYVAKHKGSLWLAMIFLFVVAVVIPGMTFAQATGANEVAGTIASPNAPKDPAAAAAQAAAIAEYWTPENMRSAKPYPMPARYVSPDQLQPAAAGLPPGPPGAQPGYNPKDPNSTPNSAPLTFDALEDLALSRSMAGADSVAPATAGYPSAHTTWEYQGAYRVYPVSPIGKLFFTQGGGNWVCSASLIGYRHVVTAGHCVHSGNNSGTGWSTNVMFCPSYDSSQGGVNPVTGCWTTNDVFTTTAWYSSSGEADADLGMAVYGNVGTIINNYPGSALGYLGYGWNWGIGQHENMFGYPSADRPANDHNEFADFNGGKIYATGAEEAGYTFNWGSYPDSKVLGTTQTPGCSGGPWVFRWGKNYINHWNNNYVNGVNSHQRCWDANPPCADRYMEITSPQFIYYGKGCGGAAPWGVVDTIFCVFSQRP